MQFSTDTAIEGICANPYCTKGEDGKRKKVAVRDMRNPVSFCSQSCSTMIRYKKRYRGTNAGPVPREVIADKMTKL